jgi:hypothetical protein
MESERAGEALLTEALLAPPTVEPARQEPEPQETERAEQTVDSFADITNGDIVEFPEGVGQIEHIMTGGVLGIEGSEFAVTATATNPALQVRLWERVDGDWSPTTTVFLMSYSDVTRLDELPSE